jgi:hypothetical protein
VRQLGNAAVTDGQVFGGKRAMLNGALDLETARLLSAENVTELVIGFGYGPASEVMSASNVDSLINDWRRQNKHLHVDLTHLKQIESLLYLSINLLIKDGFKSIENLPLLKRLDIGVPIKARLDFTKMKNLRNVGIEECSGKESVFHCHWLEEIRIWHLKAEDLSFLDLLHNLKLLSIFHSSVKTLHGIPNVTALSLAHTPKLQSLDPLSVCTNISSLELRNCKKIHDLSPLSKLENLERLELDSCGEIASLHPLLGLQRLSSFGFSGTTNIADGDVSCLLEIPGLKSVIFSNRRHYNITRRDWHIKRWPEQDWPKQLL